MKAHQILSMVLAQAAADRLIAGNPATLVNNLPRLPTPNRRALTDEEVAHLAAAIDHRYQAMVLLGAFCALRPGESVALRCADLNLLRRTVQVERTAAYVRPPVSTRWAGVSRALTFTAVSARSPMKVLPKVLPRAYVHGIPSFSGTVNYAEP